MRHFLPHGIYLKSVNRSESDIEYYWRQAVHFCTYALKHNTLNISFVIFLYINIVIHDTYLICIMWNNVYHIKKQVQFINVLPFSSIFGNLIHFYSYQNPLVACFLIHFPFIFKLLLYIISNVNIVHFIHRVCDSTSLHPPYSNP